MGRDAIEERGISAFTGRKKDSFRDGVDRRKGQGKSSRSKKEY